MQQRRILAIAFVMMLVITVVTVIVVSVVFPNLQYLLQLVVPVATPTPVAAAVPTPSPTPAPFITGTARPTLVAYHPGKSLGNLVYSTTLSDTGVFGLAWSPDSTRLGVATESAQSWVATTGKGVVNYGSMGKGVVNYSLMAVVWSPDGKLVAVTGGGQGVQLYNASTGVLWKTYPDNGQAATASASGGYLSASVPLSGGSGSGATAWSPDGNLMATAFFGSYGQAVQVWNISTGQLVQTYTGHADVVGSLSWSPDGTSVASSSADGSTQVWNALTGQRIYDFEENTRCNPAVAWSPDGKTLAYLYCDQVRVVNPFTGQLLTTHTSPHDSWGLSVLAWSPDGKYIASAGDHIEVWSVANRSHVLHLHQKCLPDREAGLVARWEVFGLGEFYDSPFHGSPDSPGGARNSAPPGESGSVGLLIWQSGTQSHEREERRDSKKRC